VDIKSDHLSKSSIVPFHPPLTPPVKGGEFGLWEIDPHYVSACAPGRGKRMDLSIYSLYKEGLFYVEQSYKKRACRINFEQKGKA
jgi:hypothetical protein